MIFLVPELVINATGEIEICQEGVKASKGVVCSLLDHHQMLTIADPTEELDASSPKDDGSMILQWEVPNNVMLRFRSVRVNSGSIVTIAGNCLDYQHNEIQTSAPLVIENGKEKKVLDYLEVEALGVGKVSVTGNRIVTKKGVLKSGNGEPILGFHIKTTKPSQRKKGNKRKPAEAELDIKPS